MTPSPPPGSALPRADGDSPVALAVITNGDGAVLFVERRAPAGDDAPPWVFPGGKVRPSETPARAAAREAEEETGLTVKPIALIGTRPHPLTGRSLVYIACEIVSGTASPASPREVADVAWVPTQFIDRVVPDIYEPVRRHLGLKPRTAL
ncbi:NUDIX hydrolase [Streptomyces sp. NPDC020875]|uniref:NUDIX hydrolase n=1 Tax=Streptomyces sp. NPDC020875 TaxID=3154898 RepID=UPI0033D5B2CF